AAAVEDVVAVTTADLVVHLVAGDLVVQGIADGGHRAQVHHHVLDILREVVDRHVLLDRVGAAVLALADLIAGGPPAIALGDHIGVIAHAAEHHVAAGPAVCHVDPVAAEQEIVAVAAAHHVVAAAAA